MAGQSKPSHPISVGRVIADVFGPMAPLNLAESWDNVGLLAGAEQAACTGILLCVDLTEDVLAEAIKQDLNLVMAYHPPILKPITRLTSSSTGTDRVVWLAVSNGIAVYSMHTALDAADGGTNDVLAGIIGLVDVEPLSYAPAAPAEKKLVTFVPAEHVEAVAEAVFQAGAGRIGDYEKCSYRLAGEGTFFGTESTSPAVGEKGKLEHVPEIRLECVVPGHRLAHVVHALCRTHPYEEPAFDVYPLDPPLAGVEGRIGRLPKPETLGSLARRLSRSLPAACAQIVGRPNRRLSRIAVCVGAAGRRTLESPAATTIDATVTGEIRHHDALAYLRRGQCAIALGHWASERPTLAVLQERISTAVGRLSVRVARADRDPFAAVPDARAADAKPAT
ncbi:MAG: Nif3-like dinuclear metal center hexameric protein [Phycisphaerales bacterium]|nr:MAG: Nif3-like dinuclear metal center hexameric protein [Phycisphaerales bacterium]